MRLKGDIHLEKNSTEVDCTKTQVRVTVRYTLSGLDLSEDTAIPEDAEEDSTIADTLADQAKEDIRVFVTNFYNGLNPVSDEGFVGLDCDVYIYNVEGVESLKKCKAGIDIHCFYDLPISKMENLVEKAMGFLTKK